jgi:3-oxoacyl-[acyl-carrier protein] reductase
LRGAVTSWSKTLAHELAPYGITVNNILPGFILTDRLVELLKSEAKRKGITYEQELQHRQSSVPAGRIGKPEDIAFAATFLASEQASYINGINLPVDGGFLQSV